MQSIHIQIPEELHEVLKVECALMHTTLRKLTTYILTAELKKIRDLRLDNEKT